MASSAAASEDGIRSDDNTWMDVLPSQKLFDHLRMNSVGKSAIMCTIRGNFFVWNYLSESPCHGEVLTLNLNRLVASPKFDSFQVLRCTKVFGKTLSLVPEENGVYLAVHFDKRLTVLQLNYGRGENGEFGGGKKEVLCKNFSVAESLFARYDQLSLLQISWYTSAPDSLALLTSDNFIRLYSLADLECPLLELSLLPASPTIYFRQRKAIQEDIVTGFCLKEKMAIILHDNGELSLLSLGQSAHLQAPPRLKMYPSADDNHGSNPSSVLLLDTMPTLVIVADKSGMVYHCVYLDNSKIGQDDADDDSDEKTLYVVERIKIQSNEESDWSMLMLSHDPANLHGYFVASDDGVYAVHIPWLRDLEEFVTATSELPSTILDGSRECQVTYLIRTELTQSSSLGITVVWEPLLGYALITLTSGDWECMTLSLKEPDTLAVEAYSDEEVDAPFPPLHEQRSSFVKTIEAILNPSDQISPILKHIEKGDSSAMSQKDLYDFLMTRIKELKHGSFIRQREALQVMDRKIQALKGLKQHIISSTVEITDDFEALQEEYDDLHEKLQLVLKKNRQLQEMANKVAHKVQFLSPVFSEAEECMKQEMEGLTRHMQEMKIATNRAKEKSKLFKIMTVHPDINLSDAQSTTLQNHLTSNGNKIKSLTALVKILSDLICAL